MATSLLLVACTAGETPSKTGTAGTGSPTGGAGAGAAGTSGGAGTGSAGTSGGAGTGSAGSNGSAGTTGTGGTTGSAGSSGNPDGSADRGEVAGPVTSAGCAGKGYQLCLDFEDGIDTAVWMGGTTTAIDATHAAHGTHSYHLYKGVGKVTAGRLLSKTVGTIKDQVWARFYIHFSPGAPGGHGNIVAAYDQSNSWYEMGYQFDGMMGVWHAPGGAEHPRRSKPYIVDQWYCVEAFFDGTAVAGAPTPQGHMPQWFIDGAEATYYEPVKANGTKVGEGGPTPTVTKQFTRMEAGLSAYAGLELKQPDTVGDQTETRVMQDLWIDDIAFDTKRIGCIQ